MKFSLIYEAQTADPTREGDHRVIGEIMEQALLAEELDFGKRLPGPSAEQQPSVGPPHLLVPVLTTDDRAPASLGARGTIVERQT